MIDALFEQDIDVSVRLPWPTICKLAVKACCLGVSLNDVCTQAVAQAVAQGGAQ
jgi:hypothetical protein